jgi:hypothetical protein
MLRFLKNLLMPKTASSVSEEGKHDGYEAGYQYTLSGEYKDSSYRNKYEKTNTDFADLYRLSYNDGFRKALAVHNAQCDIAQRETLSVSFS